MLVWHGSVFKLIWWQWQSNFQILFLCFDGKFLLCFKYNFGLNKTMALTHTNHPSTLSNSSEISLIVLVTIACHPFLQCFKALKGKVKDRNSELNPPIWRADIGTLKVLLKTQLFVTCMWKKNLKIFFNWGLTWLPLWWLSHSWAFSIDTSFSTMSCKEKCLNSSASIAQGKQWAINKWRHTIGVAFLTTELGKSACILKLNPCLGYF